MQEWQQMTEEFLKGMTADVSERDGDGTGTCIFSFQTAINTGISCSIMLICKKTASTDMLTVFC